MEEYREISNEEKTAAMRAIFDQIAFAAPYHPAKTTPEEQAKLVDEFRANWRRLGNATYVPHLPSFRSASMIKPKGARLFWWSQLPYLPSVQHAHDYYEFGILLTGSCQHFVRDICLDLNAGDVIIIPPGTSHLPVMLTESFVWYDLGIRTEQIAAVLSHLWDQDTPLMDFIRRTHTTVSAKAYALVHMDPSSLQKAALLLSEQKDDAQEDLLLCRKEILAEHLVASVACSPNVKLVEDAPDSAEGENAIIRYINGNFRTLNRSALAQHFSYSERQISRIVYRQTGQTLQDYLCSVRMAYITNMLEFTSIPVHEIIEAAGYHNNNNFFNLFREKYHMTPGEYRRIKQECIR